MISEQTVGLNQKPGKGVTAVSHSLQSLSLLGESERGKRKQEKKERKKEKTNSNFDVEFLPYLPS